jgi:hypothetical protein
MSKLLTEPPKVMLSLTAKPKLMVHASTVRFTGPFS